MKLPENYTPLKENPVRISAHNWSWFSFQHLYQTNDLDFEPEYQRGYVWTDAQKQALLETIFAGFSIGQIILVANDYSKDMSLKQYEVLDGKQRLSTVCGFLTGQLNYTDPDTGVSVNYNDLSKSTKRHITSITVGVGITKNVTREEKINYFLQVNFTGIPQAKEHLEYVKTLLLK